MALYTGALDEVEAILACVDFERMNGLVPTVVCDAADGRPRMLAYSTPESLKCALRERAGVYWSRSRRAIWRKGEGSGNAQRLVRVDVDCDRDALIFSVTQSGPTCHSGAERCFGPAPFSWETLARRVEARIADAPSHSYTARLAEDQALLDEKILEEALEVTTARTSDDLAWECADLLYHLTVKMRANGLELRDVFAQLAARAT
jgi:phosphoribosyl-ATP pyrophosphohydrolase